MSYSTLTIKISKTEIAVKCGENAAKYCKDFVFIDFLSNGDLYKYRGMVQDFSDKDFVEAQAKIIEAARECKVGELVPSGQGQHTFNTDVTKPKVKKVINSCPITKGSPEEDHLIVGGKWKTDKLPIYYYQAAKGQSWCITEYVVLNEDESVYYYRKNGEVQKHTFSTKSDVQASLTNGNYKLVFPGLLVKDINSKPPMPWLSTPETGTIFEDIWSKKHSQNGYTAVKFFQNVGNPWKDEAYLVVNSDGTANIWLKNGNIGPYYTNDPVPGVCPGEITDMVKAGFWKEVSPPTKNTLSLNFDSFLDSFDSFLDSRW